jgi:5-(aminomethyl)-3-furanmethanol phosphate kinase
MEAFKGKSMWVVKLGGSLLGSPELECWLKMIAQHGDGQVVIVPGGGLFADAVRAVEKKVNLSSKGAHQLAVLAMNQYAQLLVDLQPTLVLADSELALAERSWQHRGIVWLPSAMVLADHSIPNNWDVTSDSLAAWLAKKLEAQKLILIKSGKPTSADANRLVEEGWVDKALPDFIDQQLFETWIVNKIDHAHFSNGFTEQVLNQIGQKVYFK